MKNRKALNIIQFLIIGIVGILLYSCKQEANKPEASYKMGRIDKCFRNPAFPMKYGLRAPMMIDFRQSNSSKGFSILEARKGGKVLHLKEWEKFGHLGGYTLDEFGNIYTAPVPYIDLFDNPIDKQNQIIRVDARTGEMSSFMNLPVKTKMSERNPFGIMGITFDCETGFLYASSLAGSSESNETGRIFQIDKTNKNVVSILENVDALSIAIFNAANGKRLYYGSARKPEIFSIALNKKGQFEGESRFEFSLAAQEGGSYDNAHRIRFYDDGLMQIKGIEFSYSLIAASDPLRKIYVFKYDSQKDTWNFEQVMKE